MASQLVGLIGHPVRHSVSPRFQQAAFDALGLDVRYEAWDTVDSDLIAHVDRLRRPGILGANVTLPHKQQVLALADERSEQAVLVGAANTLVNENGRLVAHNTDVGGFLRALRDEGDFEPRGCRAVVLGAGGAARAVVVGLLQEGAARVTVLNRHPERAARLVAEIHSPAGANLGCGSLDDTSAIAGSQLLVHCTSLGLAGTADWDRSPLSGQGIHPGLMVVDLVANPIWTPLLSQARARQCRTLGGLAMLVYQGALAFELWTGTPAPVPVMMQAARTAMGIDV